MDNKAKKKPKLEIPHQFKEQHLLMDEKYLWFGSPQVNNFGYMWLEWKYKDPVLPLVLLGMLAVIIIISKIPPTYMLGLLCISPIFLFNTLMGRWLVSIISMSLWQPKQEIHYAITNRHIFYRLPGKEDILRIPFSEIKRFDTKNNNAEVMTIKFYAKRRFQFDNVRKSGKLVKLIQHLIQKNKAAVLSGYTGLFLSISLEY